MNSPGHLRRKFSVGYEPQVKLNPCLLGWTGTRLNCCIGPRYNQTALGHYYPGLRLLEYHFLMMVSSCSNAVFFAKSMLNHQDSQSSCLLER